MKNLLSSFVLRAPCVCVCVFRCLCPSFSCYQRSLQSDTTTNEILEISSTNRSNHTYSGLNGRWNRFLFHTAVALCSGYSLAFFVSSLQFGNRMKQLYGPKYFDENVIISIIRLRHHMQRRFFFCLFSTKTQIKLLLSDHSNK